jgi:hypothetical protein
LTRNTDVAWREIADEIIIVPISRRRTDLDSVYVLNDVGARIWQLLNGERDLDDIVAVLADEYEVDRAEAEADLTEYLTELCEIGAVTEVGF